MDYNLVVLAEGLQGGERLGHCVDVAALVDEEAFVVEGVLELVWNGDDVGGVDFTLVEV